MQRVWLKDIISAALDDDSVYLRDVAVGPNDELLVGIGSPAMTIAVSFPFDGFEDLPDDDEVRAESDTLADSLYYSKLFDDNFCYLCDALLKFEEPGSLCWECERDLAREAYDLS